MTVEMNKTYRGYEIRKRNRNKWLYLAGCYNGKYKWVIDYTYAKSIKTKKTAQKHYEKIRRDMYDRN